MTTLDEVRPSSSEYFELVGRIMQAASATEVRLFFAFWLTSKIELSDVARAIFYSLDALSAKEKITREAARANKCSDEEMACVNEIIEQTKKANRHRNEFAHGLMLTDPQTGDAIGRMRMKLPLAQPEPIKREYLQEKLRLINAAEIAAHQALIRIVELRSGLKVINPAPQGS